MIATMHSSQKACPHARTTTCDPINSWQTCLQKFVSLCVYVCVCVVCVCGISGRPSTEENGQGQSVDVVDFSLTDINKCEKKNLPHMFPGKNLCLCA